jgi:hypothetical protein
MGVPLSGQWDPVAEVLTVEPSDAPHHHHHQRQQQPQELLLNTPHFRLCEWLEQLPAGVVNRECIPYTPLPLEVGERGNAVATAHHLLYCCTCRLAFLSSAPFAPCSCHTYHAIMTASEHAQTRTQTPLLCR